MVAVGARTSWHRVGAAPAHPGDREKARCHPIGPRGPWPTPWGCPRRPSAAAGGPLGCNPHRTESFKLSTDPFFVDKVRGVVGLYLDPPLARGGPLRG